MHVHYVSFSYVLSYGALALLACRMIPHFVMSFWVVYALSFINGAGSGMLWPTLNASVGREACLTAPSSVRDDCLSRMLALFSISWASGKGLGFLIAGFLKGRDCLYICLFLKL